MASSNGGIGRWLTDLGWRRIAFTIVALVPLVVYFGVFEFWRNQALLVTSWFGGFGLLEPAFYDLAHRLHEFAAAMMLWPLIVGLLAQFRSPRRHVTGMLIALWSLLSVLLAIALTGGWDLVPIIAFLGVPTVVATLLHPAGRDLIGGLTSGQVNRAALALVIVAAIPLLVFAAYQVGFQTGAIEPAHDHAGADHHAEVHQEHVEHHHYLFVAAFVFSAVGVGLVSTIGPPGAWVSSWLAGVMVGVYGLAGLLAPEAASNPGMLWNLAAILWAVTFIAVSESRSAAVVPIGGGRTADG